MASFTEHYNLKKPGYDDFGDIADINGNFDIIDTALQEAKTAGATAQTNLDTHTADKSNPHSVTKAQLGLGNVDNTSDVNKPVSTAQQAAITAVEKKIIGKSLAGEGFPLTYGGDVVTAEEGAEIFNDYSTPGWYTSTDGEAQLSSGNIATGKYSHSEGSANIASGTHSHAEGYGTAASGGYSHSEGCRTAASGGCSHSEGIATTASGNNSHSEGGSTVASNDYSHAEGRQTVASGYASHAEGYKTTASGDCSHASGFQTIANHMQFTAGKYNSNCNGCTKSSGAIDLNSQDASHTIFIIGNGTEATASNAFRITADGQCRGTKAFVGSGADFAEYFEWLDGNPNNEDRRGKFVTLDGEKIKLANDGDYILGVVSASGAFIGNSQSEDWQGKYLKDVYGDWLTQEVTVPESTDEAGNVIPSYTSIQYVVNSDFDPETEYVSREFRKEWSPVGMLGQLTLVEDGTCTVNGYCKPSANGIGTAADSGYRVLKRLDSTHVKVLVR